MRTRRVLSVFLVAAIAGVAVFLTLVGNATTVVEVGDEAAARRFFEIRRSFGDDLPLVVRQPSGALTRRAESPPFRGGQIRHLFVLAYDAGLDRLVEIDVPFWFFRLKAPAAQLLVRDTGLDLDELGVSAADLEAIGSCLVLDESSPDGSRLMVWTE